MKCCYRFENKRVFQEHALKCARDSSKSTSIEAHRNTECIDLCFQFPKYRLVRCFKLSLYYFRPMWRTVNEKSHWLIEMNIKKTLLPSTLSLLVLNLLENAVLHYAGLTQTTLKKNCGNTKNISSQFHYRRFSQVIYSSRCSTLSYY